MFTAEHCVWIGLCAVFITGMCVLSIKRKFNLHQAGCVMTAICLISEITKVMSGMEESVAGGRHLTPQYLPFHLCSLMIFVILYLTFAKGEKYKQILINFVAVAGSLGSICAILIPTNGTDFTTTLAYQCFVYHSGLLWFALYLIISRQAELGSIKTLKTNILILLSLVFIALYINGALSVYDTNYFFLTKPPMDNLPYLNLEHGWYVYFVRLIILGISVVVLFQLPFILKNTRKNKKGAVKK